jgi:hypothetical protein
MYLLRIIANPAKNLVSGLTAERISNLLSITAETTDFVFTLLISESETYSTLQLPFAIDTSEAIESMPLAPPETTEKPFAFTFLTVIAVNASSFVPVFLDPTNPMHLFLVSSGLPA